MSEHSKMIVCVTQRIDFLEGRRETRDAIDEKLFQWLVEAGFLPVAVPNNLVSSDLSDDSVLTEWLLAVKPGAFILSGGNDIGEYPQRDTTERFLLSWAQHNELPVLGICRGMQMITVWAGGELQKRDGHVGTRHQLTILSETDQWPATVNSYHNWGLVSCPQDFSVAARAEDGSVEAIQHTKLKWEGWMWHPEREQPFSTTDTMRVRRLLNG